MCGIWDVVVILYGVGMSILFEFGVLVDDCVVEYVVVVDFEIEDWW